MASLSRADPVLPDNLRCHLYAVADQVNTTRNLHPIGNPPVSTFWRTTDSGLTVLCHNGKHLLFHLVAYYVACDSFWPSPAGGDGTLTVLPLRTHDLTAADRLLHSYELHASTSKRTLLVPRFL